MRQIVSSRWSTQRQLQYCRTVRNHALQLGRPTLTRDWRNEAIAPASDIVDEVAVGVRLTQHLSQQRHVDSNGAFFHHDVRPDTPEQLAMTQDGSWLFCQREQDLHGAATDRDRTVAVGQAAPGSVQLKRAEANDVLTWRRMRVVEMHDHRQIPCAFLMISAARSPMTTQGAIVLPLVTFGMIEASAMRSRSMPYTFNWPSTTDVESRPIFAVQA
jgi:hypothetical protein